MDSYGAPLEPDHWKIMKICSVKLGSKCNFPEGIVFFFTPYESWSVPFLLCSNSTMRLKYQTKSTEKLSEKSQTFQNFNLGT